MVVKIDNDKFETGTGSVYSYQEVKNAVYRQLKRGFKMKDTCIGDVVCIKFNYDTWEIEFNDRYYIVIGEYISKRFYKKDRAEKWKDVMEKRTGNVFKVHEVTNENFMKKRREC